MAITEKQLGQSRPSTADTAVSIYSPGSSTKAVIKGLWITNVISSTILVRVYVDDNGTTYDESTAIIYNLEIPSGNMIDFSTLIAMNNSAGNIAVECDTNNGATFTIFGAEIT